MAISLVQTATGSSTTGSSVTTSAFGSSTKTDNGIVVFVASKTGTSVLSVTDNRGNPYSVIVYEDDLNNETASIWYSQAINGGSSHTVTANYDTPNTDMIIIAQEFFGLLRIGASDQHSGAVGSSSTADSTNTPNTTQAEELIYGGASSAASLSIGAGFTSSTTVNGSTVNALAEFKIASSTGAYKATVGLGSSTNWSAGVATFKAAPVLSSSISSPAIGVINKVVGY